MITNRQTKSVVYYLTAKIKLKLTELFSKTENKIKNAYS